MSKVDTLSLLLITPFFSSYQEEKEETCTIEPRLNYLPIHVFCLRTRLYSVVGEINDKIGISFATSDINQKRTLCVHLKYGDEYFPLTLEQHRHLQEKIDEFADLSQRPMAKIYDLSEDVILTGDDRKPFICPKTWFKNIFSFVPWPKDYNPIVRGNDVLVDLIPGQDIESLIEKDQLNIVDVNAPEREDLKDSFYQTFEDLTKTMSDIYLSIYKNGGIVCDEEFAARWALTPIGDASIYNGNEEIFNGNLLPIISKSYVQGNGNSAIDRYNLSLAVGQTSSDLLLQEIAPFNEIVPFNEDPSAEREESSAERKREESLYICEWRDGFLKYNTMTDFLLDMYDGLETVYIRSYDNDISRHCSILAAQQLDPEGKLGLSPIFNDNYMEIVVKDRNYQNITAITSTIRHTVLSMSPSRRILSVSGGEPQVMDSNEELLSYNFKGFIIYSLALIVKR